MGITALSSASRRLRLDRRLASLPIPVLRPPTRLLLLVLVAAAVTAAGTGRAAAATPCWKTVVNDWYDNGQIDKTYPAHCYRDALRNLPEDIRDYTSLGDDLQSALLGAVRNRDARHPTMAGASGPGNPSGPAPSGPSSRQTQAAKKTQKGFVRRAIDALGPDSADAVPWPLLILAAIAGALLLAGTTGMVARKVRARRGQVPPSVPRSEP